MSCGSSPTSVDANFGARVGRGHLAHCAAACEPETRRSGAGVGRLSFHCGGSDHLAWLCESYRRSAGANHWPQSARDADHDGGLSSSRAVPVSRTFWVCLPIPLASPTAQVSYRGDLSSETKCNTPADLIIGTADQDLRECCHAMLFAFVG